MAGIDATPGIELPENLPFGNPSNGNHAMSSKEAESSRFTNPSMNDLIEAYQSRGRPKYQEVRASFQLHQGTIIEEYFGRFMHGGAVLVRTARRGPLRRHASRIILAYDSSKAHPLLDEALRTVRREERQSAILLSGKAHQILIQSAYSLIVYLLNTIDCLCAHRDDDLRTRHASSAVASARRDLRRIEAFTHAAAQRSALWYYLLGLPLGAITGIALVIAAFESQTVHMLADSRLVASCLASGAIGAMISVMVRINRGTTLEIDFDRGRAVTLLAGGFRPIIGAVFGGVLYVLVLGGLIPLHIPDIDAGAPAYAGRSAFFFLGMAFLAGFSERWAQDTIVNSAPKFPSTRQAEPVQAIDDSFSGETPSTSADSGQF